MHHAGKVICALALSAWLLPAAATGDVVTLNEGQVLEGKATESDGQVRIVLPNATVAFPKSKVVSIKYCPAPKETYLKRAGELADTDADGWYRLGLYCSGKGLREAASDCFNKALAADADHEGARTELGFVREDGKWISHEEAMARKDYVHYKGRWITRKEAESLRAEDLRRRRIRNIRTRLRLLTYIITYSTPGKSREAREELAGMSDPALLTPLVEQTGNADPRVRSACLAALSNYGQDEAALAVLDAAMWDRVADVRHQAFIILNAKQNEKAFQATIGNLVGGDDEMRFRASEVLGAIGDQRVIPYLIEYVSWTRPLAPARRGVRTRRRRYDNVTHRWVAGVRAKVAPGVVAYEPIIAGWKHGRVVVLNDDRDDDWREPGGFTTGFTDDVILNYEA
ncbi:MAG: HEAT repeat domain-containing protein, partial [Planctomycetes bacterium]|nr:HEAT repeat domain-containing protein [Planctomycetota bacterium]